MAATNTEYPELLYEYLNGFIKTWSLVAAVDLKIFDHLEGAGKPLKATEVAKNLELNAPYTKRFLDVLTAMKLVKKNSEEETYTNEPLSSKYLVRSSPDCMAGAAVYERTIEIPTQAWLANAIRTGDSQLENAIGVPADKIFDTEIGCYKTPQEQYEFIDGQEGIAIGMTNKCLTSFDLSEFKTAVDVGGGSGVNTWALARLYPDMEITHFDLPVVLQYREKFMPKNAKQYKVKTHEGNFFEDPIPSADLYLVSHVFHDHPVAKSVGLVKKLFGSLNPGGAIVILETFWNNEKTGPLKAAMDEARFLALLRDSYIRSPNDFSDILKQAGFVDVQVSWVEGEAWSDTIMARKPK
ncbi:unnamed protein product [Owenia fusiformis]|uniref:Acetylserotonin O-methyltransferase n=1 Tax=Owenia fusiformis TaxID=6347 RepID=A0A8J1UZR6_OWEFU|nr:unnamed protein product [Owenia fusiformis]